MSLTALFPTTPESPPVSLVNDPVAPVKGWILSRTSKRSVASLVEEPDNWGDADLPLVYTRATTHAEVTGERPWFELQVVHGSGTFKMLKPLADRISSFLYALGQADALTTLETILLKSFRFYLLYVTADQGLPIVLAKSQALALRDGAIGEAIAPILAMTIPDLEALLMEQHL